MKRSHTHLTKAAANYCNTFWIVTYIKTYGKKTIWVVAPPDLIVMLFKLNTKNRHIGVFYTFT